MMKSLRHLRTSGSLGRILLAAGLAYLVPGVTALTGRALGGKAGLTIGMLVGVVVMLPLLPRILFRLLVGPFRLPISLAIGDPKQGTAGS